MDLAHLVYSGRLAGVGGPGFTCPPQWKNHLSWKMSPPNHLVSDGAG